MNQLLGVSLKIRRLFTAKVLSLQPLPKAAQPSRLRISLSQQSQTDNSIVDDDDKYVYKTVSNSKFFAKPNESETDDNIVDDDWLISTNQKKRKQQSVRSVSIKRMDKKPTPKSKK